MDFSNDKKTKIIIGTSEMDYVVFGSGAEPLIILPGLGDGITTVKGKGFVLSRYYKAFSKDFRVYIFSRKQTMEKGYTTKDMASDQKMALERLGIKRAHIMGVSQGGMIAQHFAIDYPESVKKLVLAVTVSRQNTDVQNAVNSWIKMAEENDYAALVMDTIKKTYTEKKQKELRLLSPIIKRVGKPKSFNRFLIQANACLTHDTYGDLGKINCPTLILGGGEDRVVGGGASKEMADKIENSRLIIYEGLGHGAYEEEKTFNHEILDFLLKQ